MRPIQQSLICGELDRMAPGVKATVSYVGDMEILRLTMADKHVDVELTMADRRLTVDEYAERVLAPMVEALRSAVAA